MRNSKDLEKGFFYFGWNNSTSWFFLRLYVGRFDVKAAGSPAKEVLPLVEQSIF